MENIIEDIRKKIDNKKIKQTDVENIIEENNFTEVEYNSLIEAFIKNGIEVVDEEDLIAEKLEDMEPEAEAIEKVEEEFEEIDNVTIDHYSGDSIKQYFKEISQYPVLTPEEEIRLIKMYKEGDRSVEEQLITSNLRLVVKVTLKYIKPGVFFLDLVQDGTIGLINAIKKFDPSKNYKLSTYATWWIKKEIIDSLKEKLNFIKIPNYILLTYKKVILIEKDYINRTGKKPTDEEFEKALEMKMDEINKVRYIVENKMIDLNVKNDGSDDEGTFDFEDNSTEEEIDRELDMMNQRLKVGNMLKKLDKRERVIIEYYFGLTEDGVKRTFKEIGEKLQLSSERVRILKERALKKLRYIGNKDVWNGIKEID